MCFWNFALECPYLKYVLLYINPLSLGSLRPMLLMTCAMALHVSVQVCATCVALLADGTGEGLHPWVSVHVFVPVISPYEGLATLSAGVRAFSCVHALVSRQVARYHKSLLTNAAAVGLLASVTALMHLQLSSRDEAFSTMAAQVRLLASMDSYVDVQVAQQWETFAAVSAHVRTLTRVTPHVWLQLDLAEEALAALGAEVWLVSCVIREMCEQTMVKSKALATLVTLMRSVLGVSFQMNPQIAKQDEWLVAEAALPRFALLSRRRFGFISMDPLVQHPASIRAKSHVAFVTGINTVYCRTHVLASVSHQACETSEHLPTLRAFVCADHLVSLLVFVPVWKRPEGCAALDAFVRPHTTASLSVQSQKFRISESLPTFTTLDRRCESVSLLVFLELRAIRKTLPTLQTLA